MRGSQNLSMCAAITSAASDGGRCANCRAMSLPIRASGGTFTGRSPWPASCVGFGGFARLGDHMVAPRVGDTDLDGRDLVLRTVGAPVGVLGRDDVGAGH